MAVRCALCLQRAALGYGHAVFCARDFVGDDAFLHLVGDHLYVSREARTCAQQLVGVAETILRCVCGPGDPRGTPALLWYRRRAACARSQ